MTHNPQLIPDQPALDQLARDTERVEEYITGAKPAGQGRCR
jgi:hypothetical protein